MKALYLLRHAKSSWSDPDLADHDRPLAPRGLRAAPKVGRWMAEHKLAPEAIYCSTATRARQTCEIVCGCLPGPPPVEHEEGLYLASAKGLLDRARAAPDDLASIMLVGHDPGMHRLAMMMASGGSDKRSKAVSAKFPTGALAVFSAEIERWADLKPGQTRLEHFVLPRALE